MVGLTFFLIGVGVGVVDVDFGCCCFCLSLLTAASAINFRWYALASAGDDTGQ